MNEDLEEAIKKQSLQRMNWHLTAQELEQVPVDILRTMYKDLLDNSIPKEVVLDKKKQKEIIKQCGVATSDDLIHLNGEIFALQELLEGK